MKLHLLFLLFFYGSLCAKTLPVPYSQENPMTQKEIVYDTQTLPDVALDKTLLESYKKDEDFNYKEAEEADNAWTKFKSWLNDLYYAFMRWLFGDSIATGFWGGLIQVLPYILLSLFLGGMVWLFLRIDSNRLVFEKLKAPQTFMGNDEDIIQNQDIQGLIDTALTNGQYRLAIRYYYLLALQQLSGQEMIDWQVQKTNHEYIFEIEDPKIRQQFRRVTDLYDYIWYGSFTLDAPAFAKAQTAFNNLNSSL
jgi:hypothetical protein